MKKKFSSKSALKLVSATSMTIFSLLSVFTATAAWFDSQRILNNESDNFAVATSKSYFSQLRIHAPTSTANDSYVFSATPIGTITFDGNGESTKDFDTSISFGQYDLNDPYHPLLFDFVLSESVAITNGNTFALSAATDRSFVGYNNEELSATENPLSWIISAYSFGTNAESISYTYAISSLGTSVHFADITNNDGNLSYSGFNSDLQIFPPASGTSIRHVVVIMDYYVDAIAYIYNRYLGNHILDQDNVPFFVDWVFKL